MAFDNADTVMNIKTSWPIFHIPDVKIHLHPTCFNYIQRKHDSFFCLFFCLSHLKSTVVGGVTFYREGSRFGSQLVFLHLLEFSLGFGLTLRCRCGVCFPHRLERLRLIFCPWLTNSYYFKSLKNNITEVKSWGQQPRNE